MIGLGGVETGQLQQMQRDAELMEQELQVLKQENQRAQMALKRFVMNPAHI